MPGASRRNAPVRRRVERGDRGGLGGRTLKVSVDTNVLVRAVVEQSTPQGLAAAKLLRDASLVAVTSVALSELVWVLSRTYKRPLPDIASAVRSLLGSSNIVTDRPAADIGLRFLDAGGDFADGVIAFEGQRLGAEIFVSFDREARTIARQHGMTAKLP